MASNKPAFITKYLNRAKPQFGRPKNYIPAEAVRFIELPEKEELFPKEPTESVLGTQASLAITTQNGYMIQISP